MAETFAAAAHALHWAVVVAGGVVLVLLLRPSPAGAPGAAVADLRRRAERGDLLAVATARAQRELAGPGPRDLVLPAAALASLAAAWTHALVTAPHLAQSPVVGAFFAATALAQTAWAALVLTRPSSRLLLLGAAGNAAVVALWLASRTTGLPLLGVEPVGAADLLATAYELAVVVTSVVAARAAVLVPPALGAHRRRLVVALAAAVTALLVVAGT